MHWDFIYLPILLIIQHEPEGHTATLGLTVALAMFETGLLQISVKQAATKMSSTH